MSGDGRRVLVTGAGGETGHAVVRALLAAGARPRALVRTDRPVVDHRVEVVVGDQRDVDGLVAALDGVDAVYGIAPNVSDDEVVMGEALVEACWRAGVPRVVFHSVVHPQLTAMPHHRDEGRVEGHLIGSGLDWTILQPNAYLQNVAGQAEALRAGRYAVPYRVGAALAMVDLADVAAVAARCLVERLGVHATFELSGPEELTACRIAEVATEVLGHAVAAEAITPVAWAAAAGADLPPHARERLLAMFADYDRHGSPGDATVLTALLDRPPRRLREVLPTLVPGPPVGRAYR